MNSKHHELFHSSQRLKHGRGGHEQDCPTGREKGLYGHWCSMMCLRRGDRFGLQVGTEITVGHCGGGVLSGAWDGMNSIHKAQLIGSCVTGIWQVEVEHRGDPGSQILYGGSDTHRQSAIQKFDPCVLVLHAGDL